MKDRLQAQYDSLYGSASVIFGGGKPVPAVKQLVAYRQSGRVLDIGGGEGRNALFLAERGFAVTVTDLSSVGLEKLRAAARTTGLSIVTKVQDMVVESIGDVYDVIVISFVLHHMSVEEAQTLIADAKAHTNPDGLHVITTFANEGGLYERNAGKDTNRFYPSQAMLQALYVGWDIVELTTHQTTTYAKDAQGRRMQNDVVTLVARQPVR